MGERVRGEARREATLWSVGCDFCNGYIAWFDLSCEIYRLLVMDPFCRMCEKVGVMEKNTLLRTIDNVVFGFSKS